jgi:hypothetical protein
VSTKDLSRTVLEAGRHRLYKFRRRYSHGVARAHQRAWLARLDDVRSAEHRPYVAHVFAPDKLRPAERWLASRVGRPWTDVRAEMFARFDTRTTAGRHIVFDHLLRDVAEHEVPRGRRPRYVVDDDGVLRRARPPAVASRRAHLTWLGARRVVTASGRGSWWARRDRDGWYAYRRLDADDERRIAALDPLLRAASTVDARAVRWRT